MLTQCLQAQNVIYVKRSIHKEKKKERKKAKQSNTIFAFHCASKQNSHCTQVLGNIGIFTTANISKNRINRLTYCVKMSVYSSLFSSVSSNLWQCSCIKLSLSATNSSPETGLEFKFYQLYLFMNHMLSGLCLSVSWSVSVC